MTRVQVIHNAEKSQSDGFKLCFQWCRYVHENSISHGYRYIWRDPQGKLMAHRGQAAIPNLAAAKELMDTASKEGWGELDAAS